MIKEDKVEVFQQRLYCDKCGTEMEFTGMALPTYPMQYPHKCPKCGYSENASCVYPNIVFRRLDEIK